MQVASPNHPRRGLYISWWHDFGEGLAPHTFLIAALACIGGAISGYVAVGLLALINFITGVLFHGQFSFAAWTPADNHLGLWVILLPLIGAAAAGLVINYWEPSVRGHGIPEAMQAVTVEKSMVRKRVAILKPTISALAIGSGGPFGAEGPIIQTGGAIGSLWAQLFHLSAYDRRVLLAAGAAAGMAGTFKAPLTGVVVAIELIVLEFRARSIFPIALACAVADAVSIHYRGSGPMFPAPKFTLHSGHELWLFALLGIVSGLIAWAMTLALSWIEDECGRLPFQPVAVWSPMLGALILGVIGYFYPRILGTSYSTITAMLNGKLSVAQMLHVSIAKFWGLVISLGSGTTGGVFAPSLVIGGGFGFAFAVLWRHWLPGVGMSTPGLYALAAMGAVFGGIARAPLTAVVFMFELSQNSKVVLPLLVCVVISDAVMRLVDSTSMMTEKIAKRGLYVSQDYVAPMFQLWNMQIDQVMEPLPEPSVLAPLLQAPARQASQEERIAPVAHRMLERGIPEVVVKNKAGQPIGVVKLADILALDDQRVRNHDLRERQMQ
ncbi:MAG: chloride channel protein [Terriglobales bacterium]